jgi:hypothetical protein
MTFDAPLFEVSELEHGEACNRLWDLFWEHERQDEGVPFFVQ